MVTKELIERFFRNECTREEQELVLAFFDSNPEKIGKHLDENEWENFAVTESMDSSLSKKLFENIRDRTTRRSNKVKLIRRIAIAATMVLCLGVAWMYFSNNHQEAVLAKGNYKQADSTTYVLRHETNRTGKDKEIYLEDGSLVVLSNNSELAYKVPFTNGRNIALVGRALFKVAKDKTKPFTVTSGEISTTALGTEFMVTALADADKTTVRLNEGKVVIKPLEKNNWRMKSDVYLLPGQEFIYRQQTVATVRNFRPERNVINRGGNSEDLANDNPVIPQNERGSWYMFNNQPLGQVFDQLAVMYEVKISYKKEDVEKKYFVGKFDKKESLDIVLKYITLANQLIFTKNGSQYNISK